jgi:hypothetical protein
MDDLQTLELTGKKMGGKLFLVYLRELARQVTFNGRLYNLDPAETGNGIPVACVAILEKPAVGLKYQVSSCSAVDDFDRPLASTMAIGRLKKRPISAPTLSYSSFEEMVTIVLCDICNTKVRHLSPDDSLLDETDKQLRGITERTKAAAEQYMNRPVKAAQPQSTNNTVH